MGQLEIQPFTKKGVKLTARNPVRNVIRHWDSEEDIGVAIKFLLQTGKRNGDQHRVVLVPMSFAQERHYQLDIDPQTDLFVLRTRRDRTFACESVLFSQFIAGTPVFIEQFWSHESVSDENRRAMREAYLLFNGQNAQVDDEQMELRVALLADEIKSRIMATDKRKVMRDVRLLRPHDMYIRDAKKNGRVHRKETLPPSSRVKLMDPSLFTRSFETTDKSKLFVSCLSAGLVANIAPHEGFLLLEELTYAFV